MRCKPWPTILNEDVYKPFCATACDAVEFFNFLRHLLIRHFIIYTVANQMADLVMSLSVPKRVCFKVFLFGGFYADIKHCWIVLL